jgi:hypothetical protein
VQESSVQAKIELLISQLEEEINKLSSGNPAELGRMEDNAIPPGTLKERFEKCITLVNGNYQSRISDLEREIDYLRELNFAQRLMMEDNLDYIKNLEQKLGALRATD